MRLSKPVFLHALRSQADSAVRLILAGLLGLILYAFVSGGVSFNGMGLSGVGGLMKGCNILLVMILWLLGLGLIRGEASSGSLQLVLLRPLTRATYLLSKWAALAALGLALLALTHAVYLGHQGLGGMEPLSYLALLGAQVVQVLAVCALVALFSSVPINFGELGLLALLAVGLWAIQLLNLRLGLESLDQVLGFIWRVLLPGVNYDGDLGSLLPGAALNAGILIGALAGAIAILRRREFTYADQG